MAPVTTRTKIERSNSDFAWPDAGAKMFGTWPPPATGAALSIAIRSHTAKPTNGNAPTTISARTVSVPGRARCLSVFMILLVEQLRGQGRVLRIGVVSARACGALAGSREISRGGIKAGYLGGAGSVNLKTAPRGWFALAHSRPSCASMIDRQIESPSPRPPGLVV